MNSPRFVLDSSSNAKLMRGVSQPANSGACDAKRTEESSQTQLRSIERRTGDRRGQKRHEQEKRGVEEVQDGCLTLAWSRSDHGRQGLKRQPRSHGIGASGIHVIPPKLRQATNSQVKSTIAPGG